MNPQIITLKLEKEKLENDLKILHYINNRVDSINPQSFISLEKQLKNINENLDFLEKMESYKQD